MSWIIGRTRTITWASQDLFYIDANDVPQPDTLLIEVSHDGGSTWENIAVGAPNTGSYSWEVTGPACSDAVIRLTGTNLSTVTFSTQNFDIIPEVITSLVIVPAAASLVPGGTLTFSAIGYNQDNEVTAASPIWAATGGGVINPLTGEFVADPVPSGPYIVIATAELGHAEASIMIKPMDTMEQRCWISCSCAV